MAAPQRLTIALTFLLAGGCTLLPPVEPRPVPAERPPTATGAPAAPSAPGRSAPRAADESGAVERDADARGASPAAAPSTQTPMPPASAMLLDQSRQERAAGLLDDAAASIERALRIDPDNPWLWLELGEIRLASDDAPQAAEMARRALSLASGDRTLTSRAERLLAATQSR